MTNFAGGIEEADTLLPGSSQPAATQAEEAQGFESAQEEPEAPLAADSNQSQVEGTGERGRGRGIGRGRGRGRGRGNSSRPAARTSDAAAVHGNINSCLYILCIPKHCLRVSDCLVRGLVY